jgi:hypothetical protein
LANKFKFGTLPLNPRNKILFIQKIPKPTNTTMEGSFTIKIKH